MGKQMTEKEYQDLIAKSRAHDKTILENADVKGTTLRTSPSLFGRGVCPLPSSSLLASLRKTD